jgi:hypothetical protein
VTALSAAQFLFEIPQSRIALADQRGHGRLNFIRPKGDARGRNFCGEDSGKALFAGQAQQRVGGSDGRQAFTSSRLA